jgi:hypothetical protein
VSAAAVRPSACALSRRGTGQPRAAIAAASSCASGLGKIGPTTAPPSCDVTMKHYYKTILLILFHAVPASRGAVLLQVSCR